MKGKVSSYIVNNKRRLHYKYNNNTDKVEDYDINNFDLLCCLNS